jgi:ketosteroid isomerase-like protein
VGKTALLDYLVERASGCRVMRAAGVQSEMVTVLIDTPSQASAEYVAHPTAAATGRKVHHLLMWRIVVENGQIKLLREALNTLATAQALLPREAADVPAPGMEISSF